MPEPINMLPYTEKGISYIQLRLGNLRCGVILDYPSRPSLITWVLKSGEPFQVVARKLCDDGRIIVNEMHRYQPPRRRFLKRVLLPGVACANGRRSSLVQKQRKALFFDQGMERFELPELLIGEVRGWSSHRACATPAPDLRAGRRSMHTARHWHLELSVCRCFCTRPSTLRCRHSHSALGTLVWCAGSKVSAHGTLWASETRLSTKEEENKNKVRLYFIPQVLFLFPRELWMGFASDTSAAWRWRKTVRSQGMQAPSRRWKRWKNRLSSRASRQECRFAEPLILAQWDPYQTSDLPNYKIID